MLSTSINNKVNNCQLYNSGMNETRVKIVAGLIKNRFDGNQSAFARAIGRTPAQINQWLSGVRPIGGGMARHIETKLKLGAYYLDGEISSAQITQAALSALDQMPTDDLMLLIELAGKEVRSRLGDE